MAKNDKVRGAMPGHGKTAQENGEQSRAYIYKSTVRAEYGLTAKMIEQLGPPDKTCVNPNYRSGPHASLYLRDRVERWVADNHTEVEKVRAKRSNAAESDEQMPPPTVESVLAALWALTRQAKRDRDKAQSHYQKAVSQSYRRSRRYHNHCQRAKERKNLYYQLKGQGLAHLISDGVLQVSEIHRFGNNFAELVVGGGYQFHRPCPVPNPIPEGVKDFGDEGIEAKAKKKKELGIGKAVSIARAYLDGRPNIAVFEWPKPARVSRREVTCWECGESGHLARDCSYFDEHE